MKNTFMKLAASAIVAVSASTVSAAVYEFDVNQDYEQAVADGSDISGIPTVTAPTSVFVAGYEFDGTNLIQDANSNYAYLDGPSGSSGLRGGLGVCTSPLANGFCYPSFDDNVEADEGLGVAFGQGATVNSMTFRGAVLGGSGTHDLLANGTFMYSLTGAAGSFIQAMTDVNGVWNAGGLVLGAGQIFLVADAYEFYLSAANVDGGGNNNNTPSVPLPAGGLLLLSGLAGLGIARRRK